jgi:hypothetical protein
MATIIIGMKICDNPRAADAYKLLSTSDPYDRITIVPLPEQMPPKQYVQELLLRQLNYD